jgi:hypothetical protein
MNAGAIELEPQRQRKAVQTELCRGVDRIEWRRCLSGHRRHVHNDATTPRQKSRENQTGEVDRRFEIGGDLRRDVLRGLIGNSSVLSDSRVVDQYIDLA